MGDWKSFRFTLPSNRERLLSAAGKVFPAFGAIFPPVVERLFVVTCVGSVGRETEMKQGKPVIDAGTFFNDAAFNMELSSLDTISMTRKLKTSGGECRF